MHTFVVIYKYSAFITRRYYARIVKSSIENKKPVNIIL